jgi:hypothetical protein
MITFVQHRLLEGTTALLLALASSAVGSVEKEPSLAIRMEYQGQCPNCATYVLGFLEDGSSYFLGKDGVRAMAVRGSYVRREGGFFKSYPVVQALTGSVQEVLPKNREALAKWMAESIGSGLFEASAGQRDQTCIKGITDLSARIKLKIDWQGKRASTQYCLNSRTPESWQQVVTNLVAIYEYPADYFHVPAFEQEERFVVRFAHLWEFGGRGACTAPYPQDYVMYLARDGVVTMVGRRAVYPNAPIRFSAVETDKFRARALDQISAIRAEAGRLRSLLPPDTSKVSIIGGTASAPLIWRTLHVKDQSSGAVSNLSNGLNPLIAADARPRIEALLELGHEVARLLPPVEGLDAYCKSLKPFK